MPGARLCALAEGAVASAVLVGHGRRAAAGGHEIGCRSDAERGPGIAIGMGPGGLGSSWEVCDDRASLEQRTEERKRMLGAVGCLK